MRPAHGQRYAKVQDPVSHSEIPHPPFKPSQERNSDRREANVIEYYIWRSHLRGVLCLMWTPEIHTGEKLYQSYEQNINKHIREKLF